MDLIFNLKQLVYTVLQFVLLFWSPEAEVMRYLRAAAAASVRGHFLQVRWSRWVKMEEQHYLELSENPVQFEHASSLNNVFFDEANKQVS